MTTRMRICLVSFAAKNAALQDAPDSMLDGSQLAQGKATKDKDEDGSRILATRAAKVANAKATRGEC